jgi:bifunctional enzyme CysN/CysC
VVVLPSGFTTTVAAIDLYGASLAEAVPPMSVTMRLSDEIDVSRGDMLARPNNQPTASQDIEAMVCWFSDRPMLERAQYAIKHTTRTVRALVRELHYRLDVNTLHRDNNGGKLGMNEIGRVRLRTTTPLFYDEYRRNRTTGSFVIIDESTNETVGAGMIFETSSAAG